MLDSVHFAWLLVADHAYVVAHVSQWRPDGNLGPVIRKGSAMRFASCTVTDHSRHSLNWVQDISPESSSGPPPSGTLSSLSLG